MESALFGKFLFVLSVLATTPWGRYQVMLLLEHGVTPSQYGTLQLVALPFKATGFVVWGILADTFGIKPALLASILASTVALELFRHEFLYRSLWMVIAAKALRTALNGAWPLCDAYAVKAAGVGNYGSIRVWGSASWGLSGLTVGYVLDALYSRYGYTSIFGLTYALAALLTLIIIMYFPSNLEAADLRKPRLGLADVIAPLVSNPKIGTFLLVNFFFGFVVSVSTMVLPAWTKSVHHATAKTLGLITFSTVILGLFVFYYSRVLLNRFGAKKLILIAHAGHFCRLLLYSFVTSENQWVALPMIESLHCFSFAIFWNASTSILHNLAPPEVLSTAQTMLTSTHMTVAQSLGGFFFLHIMEAYGFDLVWKLGSFLTVISAIMTQWLIVVPTQLTDVTTERKNSED